MNNTSNESSQDQRIFAGTIALAILTGVFFRLYLLRDQVLVDDEWHSMAFVMDRSFAWLLSNFSIPKGFTSIPLNIHIWLLLKTVGWSELLLRLPSILSGLLCLILGPLLARPIVGSRSSAILALMLAISPMLVFYARIVRPYSPVACLGFLAVLAAVRWMQSNQLRHGLLFAVCGVLAVYYHPFAGATVATIGVSALLACAWRRLRPDSRVIAKPSWQRMLILLTCMGLAMLATTLPALLNALKQSFSDVAGQHGFRLSTGLRFLSLVSGTANPVLAGLLWIFFGIGVVHLWQRNRWLACTLLALFPTQLLALMLLRPHSIHVGIVLARYSIILVPVILLLAASGLQATLDAISQRWPLRPGLHMVLASTFVLALLLAGPLPASYAAPNNFTNHGVFQHDYKPINWDHSFVSEFTPPQYSLVTKIRTEEISRFYDFLRQLPGRQPVVEYPMMIGDHFNPHYYYQKYHRRPVLIGYAPGLSAPAPLRGGGVYGNTYAHEILDLAPDPSKLRFRNMIDMTDQDQMRARGVEYVILHRRFEAEFPRVAPPPRDLAVLLQRCRSSMHTAYEDAFVTVFELAPAATGTLEETP